MSSYYKHTRTESAKVPYSFRCEQCTKDSGVRQATITGNEAVHNSISRSLSQKEETKLQEEAFQKLKNSLQEAYENAEKKHIYHAAFNDTCPHCGKPQSWAVSNLKNKLFENSIVSILVGLIFSVGSYFYIKSEPGRFEESWQLGVPIGIMGVAVAIAVIFFVINMVKMSSKQKKTADVTQKNLPDIQWDAVEGMIDMSRV
ncbi:hypothetical protein [Acetatifactor aquisgranensis]|jgi:hypothetical protein|uniref:hypothetical protein n=1 Tax=Acetatifactor aquisgranensis TaxID=2941233 RepID=UPI00203E4195|nr:hypothetical protein [Acetatifactor aquisgranensis]MCI8543185.1 hypothetical protein [Lachnospiraceae bacterium]